MKLNWSPPVHHSFVLPSNNVGPFSKWNCNSGSATICHPNLRGLAPLGLPGKMGVFLSSWGSSCAGDSNSSTFLSASGGVGGTASSLVGTVAGSLEAVAGMSGSSTDGMVGFSGEVAGLLSGTAVCVVSIVPGLVAPSCGFPA